MPKPVRTPKMIEIERKMRTEIGNVRDQAQIAAAHDQLLVTNLIVFWEGLTPDRIRRIGDVELEKIRRYALATLYQGYLDAYSDKPEV